MKGTANPVPAGVKIIGSGMTAASVVDAAVNGWDSYGADFQPEHIGFLNQASIPQHSLSFSDEL